MHGANLPHQMPHIHTPKKIKIKGLQGVQKTKMAFEYQFVGEGGDPNFAQDLRQ